MVYIHNIGEKWHNCDLCVYKCKQKADLKKHMAHTHNIGVKWHNCNLCDYKCKQKSHLKSHKSRKHVLLSNFIVPSNIRKKRKKFVNSNVSNKKKSVKEYDFSDGSTEKYYGVYLSSGNIVSI